MPTMTPRGEEAGECGYEVDATVVLDRVGQGLDVGGFLDHAEVVAQPLNQSACNGDGALKSVHGGLFADLVAESGKQTVLGRNGFGAGVE
jgi:hypothetical protein